MKIPINLQEAISLTETEIVPIGLLIGQGMAIIDATGVESIPSAIL